MAQASLTQQDWGGGVHRGRRAPANAVYDAVNALVDDEGFLFRRGGSEYKSSADAGEPLVGIAAIVLPLFGPAILAWGAGDTYVLNSTDDSVSIGTGVAPRAFARGAGVGDSLFAPSANPGGGSSVVQIKDDTPEPIATDLSGFPFPAEYVAAVGAPARLIATTGNRAYFSDRGDPTTIASDSYHELPLNAQIIGADSLGDTAIMFTTAGVWGIVDMSLDPVDAFGNIQHQVAQINKDLILWGDPGVASYAGGLIVPGVDDVWMFSLGGPPVPITGDADTEKIRRLYRSYVKAGYQPGLASVHRGHYFLPILNGTTWVDSLVCRLDRGAAWTRWSGHAASTAFAQRLGASTRSPKMFGVSGERITELTGTFDPAGSNAAEADGTVPDCVITTRDYPTGGNQHGFVDRVRLRYELVDGGTPDPTVAVAFSSDQDGGVFTTLTDRGAQNGGAGWGVGDGSIYQWAKVRKRRERVRYRITQSGPAASFVLRSIEQLLRPTGRQ